jgi:hypothetical protein
MQGFRMSLVSPWLGWLCGLSGLEPETEISRNRTQALIQTADNRFDTRSTPEIKRGCEMERVDGATARKICFGSQNPHDSGVNCAQ